jgi:hypothetical protein
MSGECRAREVLNIFIRGVAMWQQPEASTELMISVFDENARFISPGDIQYGKEQIRNNWLNYLRGEFDVNMSLVKHTFTYDPCTRTAMAQLTWIATALPKQAEYLGIPPYTGYSQDDVHIITLDPNAPDPETALVVQWAEVFNPKQLKARLSDL